MKKRSGRHRKPPVDPDQFPEWMLHADVNECLYSVGEDVLAAKILADKMGAASRLSCSEIYSAAMKSFRRLNDESLSIRERSAAGNRAMRKFWEAKVAARKFLVHR